MQPISVSASCARSVWGMNISSNGSSFSASPAEFRDRRRHGPDILKPPQTHGLSPHPRKAVRYRPPSKKNPPMRGQGGPVTLKMASAQPRRVLVARSDWTGSKIQDWRYSIDAAARLSPRCSSNPRAPGTDPSVPGLFLADIGRSLCCQSLNDKAMVKPFNRVTCCRSLVMPHDTIRIHGACPKSNPQPPSGKPWYSRRVPGLLLAPGRNRAQGQGSEPGTKEMPEVED